MSCLNCGNELSKRAKFCSACGHEVSSSQTGFTPNDYIDESMAEGIESLLELLKKFNKDIDPRDHSDLMQMIIELDLQERTSEIVEALEIIEPLQDDDDALAALLAAYPDFGREFRIYNQTVKIVLSYLNDQNLDD